jgi:hypothetical protein
MVMIRRKSSFTVTVIVFWLVWMKYLPAASPPEENLQNHPPAEKKAGPKGIAWKKLDQNEVLFRLLMVDSVQKDLGLTTDQMEKLRDLVKVGRKQLRDFQTKWPEVSVPGVHVEMTQARAQEFDASSKKLQNELKELYNQTIGILTPSQKGRLEQIEIQEHLAGALTRPKIIKALNISEEQLAKIRSLTDGINEKIAKKLRALDGLSPQEYRKKEIEFAKELAQEQIEENRNALKILAPEQRTKLEKIIGKKVELKRNYEALAPDNGTR